LAGWGEGVTLIAPEKVHPKNDPTGAYHAVPVIKEETDIEKIVRWRDVTINRAVIEKNKQWGEEVFDGLLTPVSMGLPTGFCPFDYLCEIRGIDNVFIDMVERPEWIKEAMRYLYYGQIATAKQVEEQRGLHLNNLYQECFNGGLSYTDELPAEGFDPEHIHLKDLWGFTCAQAAVSISPEMHERFVTQFDREFLGLFGLNAIACCEAVDHKMHLYRIIPNLRRISISEFNNFGKAAEEIGTD